jgi:hypothetical protein
MPGTGAGWDTPEDPTFQVAAAVAGGYWDWQGVAYPASVFPMGKSVDAGVAEHLRLLDLKPPEKEWGGVYYSQSGIVAYKVFQAIQGTRHADTLKCMLIFGPPCREVNVANGNKWAGWEMPGANTRGISQQRFVDTPDYIYDFVNRGDIYAEVSDDDVGEDMTMIYNMVQDPIAGFGDFSALTNALVPQPDSKASGVDFSGLLDGSALTTGFNSLLGGDGSILDLFQPKQGSQLDYGKNTLIEQLIEMMQSPLTEFPAAIGAIINGLGFVVGQPWPTYPHTSYDVGPAIRLLNHIGATVPVALAA